MSQALRARVEILKLARLLHRDPAELEYLSEVPCADIEQLREQVTEVLFSAHNQVLSRLVAASRLLPVPVVAAIGERAFGPALSARVAGLLDPERAVEMAGRLPVEFLADVAAEIDPRRASAVIARIPPVQIAAISRVLLDRGEYVTMGRFVGHLQREAILAAVSQMGDSDLLQVAFVLESKRRLPELIGLLAPERIDGIIDAAAAEDLWAEVLDLIDHLGSDQVARLADAAAARGDGVLGSLIACAQRDRMWAAALPLAGAMSAGSRQRFAELKAIEAPGVLEEIVAVARECQLWPALLPWVPSLPEAALVRVGTIVRGLGLSEEELAELQGAGRDPALAPGLALLTDAAGLPGKLARTSAPADRHR